jgi:iron(III) transport system substrate-binding protein
MVLLSAVCSWAPPPALAQGNLNAYCSVQAEWCQAVANEFQRQGGIRVAGLTLKGLAQVTAEAANPKGDVWFGGTGDPHANGALPGATVALTLAGHGITLIRP